MFLYISPYSLFLKPTEIASNNNVAVLLPSEIIYFLISTLGNLCIPKTGFAGISLPHSDVSALFYRHLNNFDLFTALLVDKCFDLSPQDRRLGVSGVS